jgi:hypothetical protein
MRGPILIAGAMAQQPRQGGLSWFFLQLLLGFRRLGSGVLFLDRLEPGMCVDAAGRPCDVDRSENLSYFLAVMRRFGLDDAFSLACGPSGRVIGRPREDVLRTASEAELLLNVMAYLDDEQVLGRVRRRVFVDIDPGFPQMWRELGLADVLRGHDQFVTLGMNVGQPGCGIPTCGLSWITTPQPVVLEQWPVAPPNEAGAFTSIGGWRGPNAPVEYKGTTYGLRAHEFRKFACLPPLCRGTRFEMAFDIHPAEVKDLDLLRRNGWSLVDPKAVAGTPEAYRAYVAGSKAEFMVPKHMYVQGNSGLLSDRSAYYLASGKPVLARDTGITGLYPTGEGLITFSTPDEAAAGVEAIHRDYARHATAARAIAKEFFDSDKVLTRLLKELNV